jgi:hypothetical protein
MPLAAAEITAAPVIALMFAGVVIAIAGHLFGSRAVVATGLAILFLATAAMVVGGFVAYQGDPTDPREERDVREPGF